VDRRPPALVSAARIRDGIDAQQVPRLKRRLRLVLVAISALGSTGYLAAVTVGTLAASEISGGPTIGGAPTAMLTFGTALAAGILSNLMLRSGRRPGILIGLGIGLVGALVAVAAVLIGSIPLLLLGSALGGFANGASQLGRYVAADLATPERRASAVGLVVWGSTAGAVIGPNLIGPGGMVADAIGVPTLSGAYVLTALFIGTAMVVAFTLLRPEPYALADPSALAMRVDGGSAPSAMSLLVRPVVLVALVTLIAGQVVMSLMMTMTPIHLVDHGHGLTTVGLVLSAHLFGMYGLSPVSGRLTDRFGSPTVIFGGLCLLGIAALMAAMAPSDVGLVLALALFLLGFGWNLGFVAGSALLTHGLALGERTRVQGIADGLIWTSSALASLSSGIVVASLSYTALGMMGIALLVGPFVLLLAYRPRLHLARP